MRGSDLQPAHISGSRCWQTGDQPCTSRAGAGSAKAGTQTRVCLCPQPDAAQSALLCCCCAKNSCAPRAGAHPAQISPHWLCQAAHRFGRCQDSYPQPGRGKGCLVHPPAWPLSTRRRTQPEHSQAQWQICVKVMPNPWPWREWPLCPHHADGSFGPD